LPATPTRAIKSQVELCSLIVELLDCNHDLEGSMNLVFASGFLVPQHVPGIDYFNGVEQRFTGRHQMLFPDVRPLAGCDERANELADAIVDAISNKKFPDREIHIIAHSMGGLDCRSLIGRNLHGLAEPGRIVSLTTLSTPHFGSPVADLLVGPKPGIDPPRFLYETARQVLGQLDIPIGALDDLTTARASQIPDVAKTHPHIRYRSCFAAGRAEPFLPTSVLLKPAHDYVVSKTGQPNDGLVARDSAIYGEFQKRFFPCDHADLVGHNLDSLNFTGFQFDHLTEFEALIGQL
jgi:triacylglycerol lipase